MAELILPSGHVALVDNDDLPAVLAAGPWHDFRHRHRRYVRRQLSSTRRQYLHRFILGDPPHDIDHANGDGLDNRRGNLRPCSESQNAANARKRKDNTSGYRGVSSQPSGRWRALIRRNQRLIYLGMFDTPEDAARAYDAAAIAAWGEYARPNFPRT